MVNVLTSNITVYGRPFVKRFALCYRTVVLSVLSVWNIGVLWRNGCTDQDESWHAGRPRPWPHCEVTLFVSSVENKATDNLLVHIPMRIISFHFKHHVLNEIKLF